MSKRLSLIMTDVDEQVVSPYVSAGTAEHEALRTWAAARGDHVSTTEASALRALLRAGVEQLRDSALEEAYDELAEDLHEPDLAQDRRAARNQYAARTDRARQ